MVGAKSLGDEARQAQWATKGHGRRRAQARGHSAPDVGRGDRVPLGEEGGCPVTSDNEIKGFPQHGGKRRPCRDDGGGEIARFFASSQSERLRLHIDPPASSYAIMRRAGPYRGENSGPGKDDRGELDIETRNHRAIACAWCAPASGI